MDSNISCLGMGHRISSGDQMLQYQLDEFMPEDGILSGISIDSFKGVPSSVSVSIDGHSSPITSGPLHKDGYYQFVTSRYVKAGERITVIASGNGGISAVIYYHPSKIQVNNEQN